jgi:hypothetical protein
MLENDTSEAGKKKMRYSRRMKLKATYMVVICSSITVVSHVPTFINYALLNTPVYVNYGKCISLWQSASYEIGYIPNFFIYLAFNKDFYEVFTGVFLFVLRRVFFCSAFDAWSTKNSQPSNEWSKGSTKNSNLSQKREK